MTAALVIALLAADGRVDMPIPAPIVAVRPPVRRPEPFWRRSTKIEAGVMLGLAAADMTQTCRNLAHGGHEVTLTQSCGVDVALTVGFEVAAVGGAWLLHRMGHDRLAKVPMAYMASTSASGIIYSKEHGAW